MTDGKRNKLQQICFGKPLLNVKKQTGHEGLRMERLRQSAFNPSQWMSSKNKKVIILLLFGTRLNLVE